MLGLAKAPVVSTPCLCGSAGSHQLHVRVEKGKVWGPSSLWTAGSSGDCPSAPPLPAWRAPPRLLLVGNPISLGQGRGGEGEQVGRLESGHSRTCFLSTPHYTFHPPARGNISWSEQAGLALYQLLPNGLFIVQTSCHDSVQVVAFSADMPGFGDLKMS